MTMSAKIRRYLAKGTSIAEIAKRLGVSKNNIWNVLWKEKQKEKQKKIQVERNHDPKVVKAEKEYIKKVEALYKKPEAESKQMTIEEWAGETKPDLVNHPPHYRDGGIEVIDFIEAKDLNFRLGNAIKYISRAGKKASDPVQDLEKAVWYLKREIDARKGA